MICYFQNTGFVRFALLFSISLAAFIAPCSFELFHASAANEADMQPATNSVYTLKPVSLLSQSNVAPKAGDLDPTFGFYKDGAPVYDISGVSKDDYASAAALQPDGKIVSVGSVISLLDNRRNFAIVRYNSDGNLDTTFNQTGVLEIDIAPAAASSFSDDFATAVIVQSDGKIVVAGQTSAGTFALLRINSDGTLDTSFGSGGIVVAKIGAGGLDNAFIQPDGKIVTVGFFNAINQWDFALVRYNPNGSLDTSFGSNGIVRTDLHFGSANGRPIASIDRAHAAALLPDGKIVVVGKTDYEEYPITGGMRQSTALAVVRYNNNGGFEAQVKIDLTGNEGLPDVVIQPDGKILAAAQLSVTSPLTGIYRSNFALLRLNSDLTLDFNFGSGGVAIHDFVVSNNVNINAAARAIALQPDGKIVVAGDGQDPVHLDYGFLLARYNSDGSLDTGFGKFAGFIGGNEFFGLDDRASDVVIQPDGKIVVAGYSTFLDNGILQTDFAIARYFGSDPIDFVPPILTMPDSVTTEATSPEGAKVNYTATITDNLDPNPAVNCTIPSGSIFSIGTTTVTCTATDFSGNSTSKTFQVIVKGVADQLTDLIAFINNMNLSKPPAKKMDHGLDKVQNAVRQGDMRKVCGELDKFIQTVRRESGRNLTPIEASQLLDSANRISAVQGC